MPITSLQVCMDSSDWLQGSIAEDQMAMPMDNSSPITPQSGEIGMLTCSRPMMMEPRRLRPQHEQPLKCPRCESTHTKFCYYNNYSLTQPRYFCKTCRRYWTKGGTLRNVPVGGGCRKTKKQSSNSKNNPSKLESPSTQSPLILQSNDAGLSSPALSRQNNNSPDLHLAFSEQMQFLSLHGANPSFLLENQTPVGLMENKYEALLGGNYNFMGNNNNGENFGGLMGLHDNGFHGILPQFGMMPNSEYHGSGNSNTLESSERQMVPFENLSYHHLDRPINHDELQDVKPNAKFTAIEWQDQQQQQASNSGRESFCYNFGGFGSWTGLMNGYGSSATNPLV